MYVLYRQNMKVQEELSKFQFRTFIPMETISKRQDGKDIVTMFPAVHNLIFVYSTMKRITWMKMFNETGAKMQYMSRISHFDGTSQVITVPQRQMDNIIAAATAYDPDGLRSYIDTPAPADPAYPGRMIRFVGGPFTGIEGTIKRVNKNRVMLIDLPNSKSIQLKISRAQDIYYL